MPTTLTNGIQLPDKGSVDWYSSMESNYNLIDTHLGDTDVHVTAEDKANWNSKQGSLSQDQLDAIAQVATNTDDIATLQSSKADASHTHSSSDITDIDDYATKDYVDNSISGLVDNAPDALNTLNELSAALNDDSNFATTVTNALAAKADSSDLATVATSGDYDDLSNKPTINDSTITIQKNGSTVDTFTTNGSDKTIDISVPTKTSDLTNDSNFVESSSLATVATSGFYNDLDNLPTIPSKISDLIDDSNFVEISNPAVSSGITSTKVTDYDTHIADTDIHVTTADKNRWNNQTYVFRYSSTALTASSTNSNALLDNTDNLKVGDKVIDSSGVLFSITAIDTENSTFTIGTALIDLAQDSDVVHKSGDEDVIGSKRFGVVQSFTGYPSIRLYSTYDDINVVPSSVQQREIRFTDKNNAVIAYFIFQHRNNADEPFRTCWRQNKLDGTANYYSVDFNNLGEFYPENNNAINLGGQSNRWKSVYATNYYYGIDNVEFSDKFVTTDTNQTIPGQKVFTDINVISDSAELGSTAGRNSFKVLDKNKKILAKIEGGTYSSGMAYSYWLVNNGSYAFNGVSLYQASANLAQIRPYDSTLSVQLGASNRYFSNCYTSKINNLEPSSLSLPSGNASDFIDISSYFSNTGSTTNSYTAPANGWIFLRLGDISSCQASIYDANNNMMWGQSATGSVEQITIPILKGQTLTTRWATTSSVTVATARFIPCQGNV